MKIYSANNVATVTFTTSTGLVVTVGHFYRGEPLYLEGGIKVTKIVVSEKYDYFIGYSQFRYPSVVAVADLGIGDRVIIRTDRRDIEVVITNVIQYGKYKRYMFEPRVIEEGDSGSPVMIDDKIIGYVTHVNSFMSIEPVLDAIVNIAKRMKKTEKV